MKSQKKFDIDRFLRNIVSDEYRYYYLLLFLSVLLGLVALTMGIINIFTHKTVLMWATLSFSAISVLNAILLWFSHKAKTINYVLFEVSVTVLFTYFLITGGTAGFSPHWILLLPSCGLLFVGKKRGLIFSILMFVIVIFLLWTPLGNSLLYYQDYTPEFKMRFPVVYFSFFLVGYTFELIRSLTYRLMIEAQNQLADAATTDVLTGIHNRRWFNDMINGSINHHPLRTNGLFILCDIDDFKKVNDTYGHSVGDEALIYTARTIRENIRCTDFFCRWGGEEFLVYLPECQPENALETCDRIRNAVASGTLHTADGQDFSIQISLGAVVVHQDSVLDAEKIFTVVDQCLYQAKNTGKNRTQLLNDPEIFSVKSAESAE